MRYKLLIAEDELNEYELVTYLMEKYSFNDSFEVIHASNGKQAYEILENDDIDVLMTDIEMPFVNGLELAKKARDYQKQLPIIFFSCYDNFTYAKTALSVKACNYMLKPLDPSEFEKTMSDTLQLIKSNEEAKIVENPESDQIIWSQDNPDNTKHAVTLVKQYINSHYNEDISLNTLSDLVYLNTSYLSTIFKNETGCGINKYIKAVRMKKAKELIIKTNMKISDIGNEVGFRNTSYFVKSFHEYFGETPEKLRQC